MWKTKTTSTCHEVEPAAIAALDRRYYVTTSASLAERAAYAAPVKIVPHAGFTESTFER
jgi:hypothetical protein